jgi:hypothetical protein
VVPVTSDEGSLLAELAERGRAVGAAKQRARAVELEHDQAQADVERLKTARIDTLAGDDDELAGRLRAELDQAERAVRDLGDRLTAARLQSERAEGARQQFASDNIHGLLGEHERDAQAAADAVTAALDQLQAAHGQWREAEAGTLSLLRLGGRVRDYTPPFPSELGDLLRRLSRSSATIPAPLPTGGGPLGSFTGAAA